MSEIAELLRGAYESYNRGEVDAVLDLLHPEVEWVPPPSSVEPHARVRFAGYVDRSEALAALGES